MENGYFQMVLYMKETLSTINLKEMVLNRIFLNFLTIFKIINYIKGIWHFKNGNNLNGTYKQAVN